MRILITNARLLDPAQDWDFVGSLLLADGQIALVNPPADTAAEQVIDGAGWVCAPGLIDLHVHLRDPGQTHKEDIRTASAAAAAGGVTTLVAMPNTHPTMDSPTVFAQTAAARAAAAVRILQAAAVSRGLGSREPVDFDALVAAGAAAFSDDGLPMADADIALLALRAAARLGVPLLAHCEDQALAGKGIIHEGAVSQALGVPGISAESEVRGVRREIACAQSAGVPVHICHVSTRASCEAIRAAKAAGVRVTAETAPHYFALTDENLRGRDADYRMNPPLRTADDRAAIRAALADGTLDCIATDHAPHTPAEKADFLTAPNGVLGLETSLAAGITYLVQTGVLTLAQLIDKMSCTPARILGTDTGTLALGHPADVVLFDPNASWTVDPEALHSKSRNTAFKAITLTGQVKMTLCRGQVVYSA
ncbi:MAG: dihydroorotase [Oscillospiraceae bacterium]|jgi:dihydroorotase|nr:dihydroorotase [Oscillospiraceae bacterium]